MNRVQQAAEEVLAGRLIVLPTDTVYGIGTRPDRPDATGRLFDAKRRPRELTLPVLVASEADAASVGILDERARALAERFWPGPLTVVVPRTGRSRDWDLGGDAGTVGLRRPRHLLALAVLERTGPLAVTSANLSGAPTPSTCDELVELFGDAVSVYLCQDEPHPGVPSTVVDLAHGEPVVLRSGAVPKEEILKALSEIASGSGRPDPGDMWMGHTQWTKADPES
ncbi:MAG: L-threonylcarbamoyladenylate synthase [Actinomycetota bacterium]|nr:L-threonylcarbamoyladenylate synthase [Actinomycetota bacterium]